MLSDDLAISVYAANGFAGIDPCRRFFGGHRTDPTHLHIFRRLPTVWRIDLGGISIREADPLVDYARRGCRYGLDCRLCTQLGAVHHTI